MSSPDSNSPTRRRAFRLGAALASAFALGGCFQPLYGTVNGVDVTQELRSIAVDPAPDRFGHYLVNELVFGLNGTGAPGPVKYRLLLTHRNAVQTPIIDNVTGRADSATISATVDYRLTPAAGGSAVLSGSVTNTAGYDRSSQRFANIRAARDAEIRLAKTMADQIRTRLAAGLAAKR